MVAYSISRMQNIGQVLSESKAFGRYLAGFHPRYTGWEIKRTQRTIEMAENRAGPGETDYSWDAPAVQVPHSDEDLFLHALELRAQYVKQGKTLKSVQDSLTADQRNAIEKVRNEQNRQLEEETIELEWHLAGIDRLPSSYSSRLEPLSLFVILKTGWSKPAGPAITEHDDDAEGVEAFRPLVGDNLVIGHVEARNAAYEGVGRAPVNIALGTEGGRQARARARARAVPVRAPIVFVDSVADAMQISDNAPHSSGREHARMHSRLERETAYETSRRSRRQRQGHRSERQEMEERPIEYQVLGPNLAANYAKMPVEVQKRHIDTLIREWVEVIECLPATAQTR